MLSPQTTAVRSAMHPLSTTRFAASAPDGDFVRLRDVHKAYGPNLVVMDGMNLDMRVLEVDPIHRRIVLTVTDIPADQPPRPETPPTVHTDDSDIIPPDVTE